MPRYHTKAYYFELYEDVDDNTTIVKKYKSLKEMSNDTLISYNTLKNISSGRFKSKEFKRFRINKVYR